MHYPTDRIAHTTDFVTPVVEHWLEREIAQWVHPMKGSIRWPIAPWANTLTTELHLAPHFTPMPVHDDPVREWLINLYTSNALSQQLVNHGLPACSQSVQCQCSLAVYLITDTTPAELQPLTMEGYPAMCTTQQTINTHLTRLRSNSLTRLRSNSLTRLSIKQPH